MKHSFFKKSILFSIVLLPMLLLAQDFQGKAYYFSKSTMELGSFGATMSEAQKKKIQERLKNRLEKTYILTFNKEESVFKEDEKVYSRIKQLLENSYELGIHQFNLAEPML